MSLVFSDCAYVVFDRAKDAERFAVQAMRSFTAPYKSPPTSTAISSPAAIERQWTGWTSVPSPALQVPCKQTRMPLVLPKRRFS
jgi:hypothetical protein